MEREKFLECEYQTLRDEIKQTKNRLFKLAGIGLIGMPSAYSIAKIYDIQVLVLSLPILICTIVLLYLSESRALMRCGTYIKEKIEPNIRDTAKGDIGWEHWLSVVTEGKNDRRAVDKFLAIFFYILFAFYYVASVHLALTTANNNFGVVGYAATLGTYIGVGILFIWFLFSNFRPSTSTSG